jgi:hypothetical protein
MIAAMNRPHTTLPLVCALLSCGGQDPADDAGNGPAPAAEMPEANLRRLTAVQVEAALTQLLGPDLVMPVSLEPDLAVDGLLSIGSATTSVSAWGVERYEDAAYLLAEQVMADPDWLADNVPCGTAFYDAACTEQMVDTLGRQAWRRPLSDVELGRLVDVVDSVSAASGDFTVGLTYGLGALLQSPHFLYRIESGESDSATPGQRQLTDWELATRLSFLLWNTPPDEMLLDAVSAGELADAKGLRQHAERMIADPRYVDGVRAFFEDVLELYRLDDLDKDPLQFTHASPDLGASAREETLLGIVDLIVDQDGDFRDIMTRRKTFIDQRLGALYQVEAPIADGFGTILLPNDGQRRGLLSHASMLNLHAHATSTSATLRGVFIRQTLLCQVIPPPPAGLNTSIPEPDVNSPTLRERLLVHQEDPVCASCHLLTDPVGLGLENFDGVGRWRLTENEATIDPSGDLDGLAFADAWELGQRIQQHPDFAPCWADHLYAYSTAHEYSFGEVDLMGWLYGEFEASGYGWKDLTVSLVTSPAFRQVGEVVP